MGNRRGRRLAIRLAACGLLGAVVTVGVAWGLVVYPLAPRHVSRGAMEAWPFAVSRDWPEWASLERETGIGVRWSTWEAREDEPTEFAHIWLPRWFAVVCKDFGWPFVSMRRTLIMTVDKRGTSKKDDGISERAGEAFPPAPLMPGFAVDSVFYGAIAFVLWSAPGVVRRRRWRARGRCGACGYDLAGLPAGSPCPECAVRSRG